jgi:hypothetical protein
MLSELEYLKAKKYLDELRQCNDELHKLWKNNADHHFVKQRELYIKRAAETLAAIPIEFGCSPKELKTQVKDHEKWREKYPPHHEPERVHRSLKSSVSDLFNEQLKQKYTLETSPERRFSDIYDHYEKEPEKLEQGHHHKPEH